MKILANGRDGDIFEFAPGLVLRKTRDGRSIAHEARTMRYVAEHGYPVPHIEEVRADGTEIIMERVDGPMLMDAIGRPPWKLGDHLGLLADLLDRLHEIPAPDWLPGMPGSQSGAGISWSRSRRSASRPRWSPSFQGGRPIASISIGPSTRSMMISVPSARTSSMWG